MTERKPFPGSYRRIRCLLSAFSAFSAFSALSAQATHVSGRVITADSAPVPRARVVLHRVGREVQGPLDSTRADRQGRFRLTFQADTGSFYLLSAQHAGIEYFSQPVHTNPERPDTGLGIVVYDTSSTAPVTLEARHLVVTRPGEDGSRSVLDLMVLRNDGRVTRVSSDSTRPSWVGPLPRGTIGLDVAESDFSRDAVARQGDSVLVIAPLSPGEKQLTVQYLIPSNRKGVDLPIEGSGVSVNVLAEEKGVRVSGGGMALADSQVLQGRSFRRWTGVMPTSGLVHIVLPGGIRTPDWLLALLVGLLTLILAGAGWRLIARQQAPLTGADQLLDTIAALDARYAGREENTPSQEWTGYQSERARLKALLEASLAAGSRNQ